MINGNKGLEKEELLFFFL